MISLKSSTVVFSGKTDADKAVSLMAYAAILDEFVPRIGRALDSLEHELNAA